MYRYETQKDAKGWHFKLFHGSALFFISSESYSSEHAASVAAEAKLEERKRLEPVIGKPPRHSVFNGSDSFL